MSVEILTGDCREILPALPQDHFHTVVTSPPYFGLRAYHGEEGMIGNEENFEDHIRMLVDVFRDVRRVLHPSGTVWLNYGDIYSGGNRGTWSGDDNRTTTPLQMNNQGSMGISGANRLPQPGIKGKDLMLMPARVAIALCDDGWWVRSEIVWHKPNPMPSSARDRPTAAHEKIFLLSKKPRYFYDAEAVRQPLTGGAHARRRDGRMDLAKGRDPGNRWTGTWKVPDGWDTSTGEGGHGTVHKKGREQTRYPQSGGQGRAPGWRKSEQPHFANIRNVWFPDLDDLWTLNIHGFKGAHFATFPPSLAELCIKAGSSQEGVCASCGAPWRRITEKRATGRTRNRQKGGLGTPQRRETHGLAPVEGEFQEGVVYETVGWEPSCACEGRETVPARVLDPFGGSGTVGLVADRLGRDATLVEISPEYATMARARISGDAPLFSEVS